MSKTAILATIKWIMASFLKRLSEWEKIYEDFQPFNVDRHVDTGIRPERFCIGAG